MIEINIPKWIIQKYIEKKENKQIKITAYQKLGSGWHGTGYKIAYNIDGEEKIVILRTLKPAGFSHDYKSDRAKVFILQHTLSKNIPNHIKSLDVGGYNKDGSLVSLGNCEEFFQIVEIAKGREYVKELNELKKRGTLTKQDKKKALLLSDYLVKLHKTKFKGKKELADSIYKRHLRDCICDGEMLMGVLDTYPAKLEWTNKNEIIEIMNKAVRFRENIKHLSSRLCRIHGDFHPGNIIFSGETFKVLDASREEYGDSADDLTSLALNYFWYSLQQNNNFSGVFKELFELFWGNYIKKTNDVTLDKIAPLFFAFRGVVMAHPLFYPNQSDDVRKKIFGFVNNVLNNEEFKIKDVSSYIK